MSAVLTIGGPFVLGATLVAIAAAAIAFVALVRMRSAGALEQLDRLATRLAERRDALVARRRRNDDPPAMAPQPPTDRVPRAGSDHASIEPAATAAVPDADPTRASVAVADEPSPTAQASSRRTQVLARSLRERNSEISRLRSETAREIESPRSAPEADGGRSDVARRTAELSRQRRARSAQATALRAEAAAERAERE